MNPTVRALVGVAAAAILLAGCSSNSESVSTTSPSPNPTTSATPGASASATPSPSSTLTAEEQQAFEEATAVVLAYRQTITDLYSGARTNLNDLNEVAAGSLRDDGLKNIQQSLSDGWRYEPANAEVGLSSSEPVEVNLRDDPATVIARVCIVTTNITGVAPDGTRTPGIREELDYTVSRTTYLPRPGWAVTRVSSIASETEGRTC